METYLRPIFAWDSFANWSAGAKAFYYSHSLLLNTSPEDFFGKGLLNRNANYPPHNPLMQVWMSLWIGHFDEVFVKFWSPVYLLAMSIYLYVIMAKETSRLIALSMLVLFLSSPLMSVHSIEAYSDVSLSVYILFSLIMFLFAMRGKSEYWALIGFYSAEALFTKDEAPFFVIPLLMAAIIFYWQNREQGLIPRKAPVPSLQLFFWRRPGLYSNSLIILDLVPIMLPLNGHFGPRWHGGSSRCCSLFRILMSSFSFFPFS